MKKITVSAPGKLMLLGEHAVVYGHPCLVTAVGQRMFVTVSLSAQRSALSVDAPDVDVKNYKKPLSELGQGEIPKGAKFVEIAVKNFLEFINNKRHAEFSSASSKILNQVQNDTLGLVVTTKSEFSSQFGFGSSSASTVCVIKALAELFTIKLSNKDIFELSYKTVLDIQGKGSGFDVAAAVYGGTLYFVTGGKTISPLAIRHLPLTVGFSGVKADTVTLINQVAEKAKNYPKIIENIYEQIDTLVEMAKKALLKEDWVIFGELMNMNQGYLEILGVSIGKLSAMIYASRNAGAYGAKLSGAGGGDCIIALSAKGEKRSVKDAIKRAGGQVIEVDTNVEGVRVER